MTNVHAELRSACEAVRHSHLRQLVALGVSWPAIGELGRHHFGFGVTPAASAGDGLYSPGEGELHLVLPVYEDGELIDLCAFRSCDPLGWSLRTGLGWALGLEGGFAPHSWADTVPLVESPLEWLRNGATGLCVIDWDAPEVSHLTDLPHIACSTPRLAVRLRYALARPQRLSSRSYQWGTAGLRRLRDPCCNLRFASVRFRPIADIPTRYGSGEPH
jgi:hypothetical protein